MSDYSTGGRKVRLGTRYLTVYTWPGPRGKPEFRMPRHDVKDALHRLECSPSTILHVFITELPDREELEMFCYLERPYKRHDYVRVGCVAFGDLLLDRIREWARVGSGRV